MPCNSFFNSFYVSYLSSLIDRIMSPSLIFSHLLYLVSGTLRSNLDPFNLHDDATLWDALKRSYLVEPSKHDSLITNGGDDEMPSGAHTPVNRFTLDTVIEDEGGNLSVGQVRSFSPTLEGLLSTWTDVSIFIVQRSLVSLARALVKNAKVIILDEATGDGRLSLLEYFHMLNAYHTRLSASVDYETDRKIQDTIAYEFKDRTILCIARMPFPLLASFFVLLNPTR